MKTTQIASFRENGKVTTLHLHKNGHLQIQIVDVQTHLIDAYISQIKRDGEDNHYWTPLQLIQKYRELAFKNSQNDILKKIEISESGENDISLWLTPNGKQHYFLSDSEKVIEYKVSLEPIEETSFDETELEQLGLALSFR